MHKAFNKLIIAHLNINSLRSKFQFLVKLFRHNPINICLEEDVLKPSRRRLSYSSSEDIFKTFSRRLDQDEYIRLTHTSSEDVFKTSSRCLDEDQHNRLGQTSSIRLQNVFKTSSRRLAKTCSRHLQKLFKTF